MDIGSINNYAAGGATTLYGMHQYFKAKKMEKANKRPDYNIPQEISQNLTDAQRMALQGLPEEQRQQFINNIQRGTAFGMSQLGSRKAGLAGLATMNQQQQDAYGNLLSMDAQARQQNQQGLMNQRQVMADYRDQQFQLNKLNPFYEKQAEIEALKGAGIQNIGNSFQMAAGQQGQGANTDAGQYRKPQQSEQWGNINNYNYGKARGGVGYDAGDYNQNLDTSGYV